MIGPAGLALSIGFGTASLAFVAYCFYFDWKRRSDPELRNKIAQKRKAVKTEKDREENEVVHFRDFGEMSEFLYTQAKLAEVAAIQGDYEQCIHHLVRFVRNSQGDVEPVRQFSEFLPPKYKEKLFKKLGSVMQKTRANARQNHRHDVRVSHQAPDQSSLTQAVEVALD